MSETLKRHAAVHDDLPALVSIYNEAIASRVATNHLEPFTVTEREAWFAGYQPPATPLFVTELEGQVVRLRNFVDLPRRSRRFRWLPRDSYYVAGSRSPTMTPA